MTTPEDPLPATFVFSSTDIGAAVSVAKIALESRTLEPHIRTENPPVDLGSLSGAKGFPTAVRDILTDGRGGLYS